MGLSEALSTKGSGRRTSETEKMARATLLGNAWSVDGSKYQSPATEESQYSEALFPWSFSFTQSKTWIRWG